MTDRAIPALPSTSFKKSARLFKNIGFDIVSEDEEWLKVRYGTVEVDFYNSEIDWRAAPFDMVSRLCVLRVADVEQWHARLSSSRVRWKMMDGRSLTSISTGAWNGIPAFCFTDDDINLFWVVEAGA